MTGQSSQQSLRKKLDAMSLEEYRKWRNIQQALPIEELIEKPNCNFVCPEGREFQCGCNECGKHKGFYIPGERERRFTKEENEIIDSVFFENVGFLTKDGCALTRKLMSDACLRSVCNYKRTPKP